VAGRDTERLFRELDEEIKRLESWQGDCTARILRGLLELVKRIDGRREDLFEQGYEPPKRLTIKRGMTEAPNDGEGMSWIRAGAAGLYNTRAREIWLRDDAGRWTLLHELIHHWLWIVTKSHWVQETYDFLWCGARERMRAALAGRLKPEKSTWRFNYLK